MAVAFVLLLTIIPKSALQSIVTFLCCNMLCYAIFVLIRFVMTITSMAATM
jgi:hypothetical protein